MKRTFGTVMLLPTAMLLLCSCRSTDPAQMMQELRERRQAAVESDASAREAEALPHLSGRLTLRDACNLALAGNLTLRATFLRRAEAAGAVEESRGKAFPQIELDAGASRNLQGKGRYPENYSAGLRITQPLWRSGTIAAGIRYARLFTASTDAEIRRQVQATVAQVAGLYLDALLQGELIRVYEESLAVAERMLQTSQNKRAAGTVSDYEVLRAEVEVSTARADLLHARNQQRTTMIALLHNLGADQQSEITLADALLYYAENHDVADLIAKAQEHRADLLQREADVEMARAQTAIARGKYGPEADIFLSGIMADPNPNDTSRGSWDDKWVAGAALRYTLFDGFERRGRLAQAEARTRQAMAALRDAEEAVRVEVTQALLDLNYADVLYQSQRKNIELAREALRILESGFRLGRNTQIEVLDAQSALTEAMGRYFNAVHLHSRARLSIRHATGTLGPADEWIVTDDYRLKADPLNNL